MSMLGKLKELGRRAMGPSSVVVFTDKPLTQDQAFKQLDAEILKNQQSSPVVAPAEVSSLPVETKVDPPVELVRAPEPQPSLSIPHGVTQRRFLFYMHNNPRATQQEVDDYFANI